MTNKEAIAALAKAQSQMKTPHKDATNPHFRNRYASLKSCIKAIKPALNTNGFALIQAAGKDEQGHFIQTTFEHTSGGMFTSKFYMEPEKKGMQGLGSAATYAKRYGLLGLAGIEPDEDADDDGNAADEKAEHEHDDAVRAERDEVPDRPSDRDLRIWADRMKEAIEKTIEPWQLEKLAKDYKKEFEAIKKYGGNLADEVIAYSKIRFDQINEGVRK
tara:strand:- start:2789 stop:3439 length:651 start_codon:yes stop_codon:yes gene_type:complete